VSCLRMEDGEVCVRGIQSVCESRGLLHEGLCRVYTVLWCETYVDAMPKPKVFRLMNLRMLLFEDNVYARILVAYRFAKHLPEGFLYSLFNDVSEVALTFRSTEKDLEGLLWRKIYDKAYYRSLQDPGEG